VGRVHDEGRERHRKRTEQHRGAPRGGELAARDDVPAHRLGEQVDHRAVVDLRPEHRGGGEQGDERHRQGEAEPDDRQDPDLLVGEQPHEHGEPQQRPGEQQQHDTASASEQGLGGQPQQGAVHRAQPPTR